MAASVAPSPVSLSESRAHLCQKDSAPPSRRKRRQRSRKSTHNKVRSANETSNHQAEQVSLSAADDKKPAINSGCNSSQSQQNVLTQPPTGSNALEADHIITYRKQSSSHIQSADAASLISSTAHESSASLLSCRLTPADPLTNSESSAGFIPGVRDSPKPLASDKQPCPSPKSENTHLLTSSDQSKVPSAKPVGSSPSKPAHSQYEAPNDQQLQHRQQKTPAETSQGDNVKVEASAKYKHHKQLLSKMKTLRQLINDTSDKTAVAQEEIKAMKVKNEMAFKKDDVRTVVTNKMCINVLKSTIKEAQSNQQKFYEMYKTLRDEVISSQWYQNNSRGSANSSRDVGRV